MSCVARPDPSEVSCLSVYVIPGNQTYNLGVVSTLHYQLRFMLVASYSNVRIEIVFVCMCVYVCVVWLACSSRGVVITTLHYQLSYTCS